MTAKPAAAVMSFPNLFLLLSLASLLVSQTYSSSVQAASRNDLWVVPLTRSHLSAARKSSRNGGRRRGGFFALGVGGGRGGGGAAAGGGPESWRGGSTRVSSPRMNGGSSSSSSTNGDTASSATISNHESSSSNASPSTTETERWSSNESEEEEEEPHLVGGSGGTEKKEEKVPSNDTAIVHGGPWEVDSDVELVDRDATPPLASTAADDGGSSGSNNNWGTNLLGKNFGEEDLSHAKKYSKKLKNRNNLNISRKMWHLTFGVAFSLMNEIIPRKYFVGGMSLLTSGALIVELLRYKKGFHWMNDAIVAILGSSLRKHEMEGKFTGSFYYFLGVLCTVYEFPRTAATLGIMQLAVADPCASYFGRRTRHVYWSRIERGLLGFGRNKGILGFLGGAACCVPFNYRMLSLARIGAENSILPGGKTALVGASLALGFAGALADLAVPTPAIVMPEKVCGIRVPPFHVDDNFVVPILSAFACTKIFGRVYGWEPKDVSLSKLLFFPTPKNNKFFPTGP